MPGTTTCPMQSCWPPVSDLSFIDGVHLLLAVAFRLTIEFCFCPGLRSEDGPVVYRCQETTLCKRARSQVSMPMPTGWDVRCAVEWGSVGGLRDPWSKLGWWLLRLGGGTSIDGRQWSCACSSVQLCAPEDANADASTPGQVSVAQALLTVSLSLVLSSSSCVWGSTGGSTRAAGRWWFNFLLLALVLLVPRALNLSSRC